MKYAKTEAGQLALKERSPQLTSRQRSAMILFDGKKTLDQVLAATAGLGIVATDIDHLLALGFLAPAEGAAPAPTAPLAAQPPSASAVPSAAAATGAALPAANKSELFSQAWPVATRLTATLGLRGIPPQCGGGALHGLRRASGAVAEDHRRAGSGKDPRVARSAAGLSITTISA
jgi:hypothetical protein